MRNVSPRGGKSKVKRPSAWPLRASSSPDESLDTDSRQGGRDDDRHEEAGDYDGIRRPRCRRRHSRERSGLQGRGRGVIWSAQEVGQARSVDAGAEAELTALGSVQNEKHREATRASFGRVHRASRRSTCVSIQPFPSSIFTPHPFRPYGWPGGSGNQ